MCMTHTYILQFCFSTGRANYDFRFSETVIDKGYTLVFYMDEVWDQVLAEKVSLKSHQYWQPRPRARSLFPTFFLFVWCGRLSVTCLLSLTTPPPPVLQSCELQIAHRSRGQVAYPLSSSSLDTTTLEPEPTSPLR